MPQLAGYVLALNYSAEPTPLMTLTRVPPPTTTADGAAAPAQAPRPSLLGSFDLCSFAGGCVDGWSVLRVALRGAGGLDVWLNPALQDTGFAGNSSDAGRTPHAPAPRISVVDAQPLPAGAGAGVAVAAGGSSARVDYVSVLPLSVL